ncbi:MAG TPA: tRNA uridine-5-carboxymethylaminomethyl(34) synthesis enzyme MnmG, partial [Gammaproteobacteria bacterium]|nr:tRNA uridine-5-carboxymethylaminomethyl(34) synthesis enzyme MnmG [Gammaproteobacteria bacterium]
GREQAYLGVLVDDLLTCGTSEPYRMFTSRAEFRLLLREDNADLRLTEKGRELGVVTEARWRAFELKREAIELERQRLRDIWIRPGTAEGDRVAATLGISLSHETRALDLLSRPELSYQALSRLPGIGPGPADKAVAEQLDIQAKYAGYIRRQQVEIDKLRQKEAIELPVDLDYLQVRGLSTETREKLARNRPLTLGQAGRIPGMTPAAISLLLIHLKKRSA